MTVESASASLPILSTDRTQCRLAIREWMSTHALTLPMACRALNVNRAYLRDLLSEGVPAKPDHSPKLGYATMTYTLIVSAVVHRNQWTNDESAYQGFDLMRDHYSDAPDVYMSLENVNGVMIAEFERRSGRVTKDRLPGAEAA